MLTFIVTALLAYVWWVFTTLSRLKWELRAFALSKEGWYVGRTDMYSYVDGKYVHYAYSPDGLESVPFFGSPRSALKAAVRYAEKKNRK